jgi:hypothetical protein
MLRNRLPVADIRRAGHRFNLVTYQGRDSRLQSVVNLTCAQNLDPLAILGGWTDVLGTHSVVEVELAFDVAVDSIERARESLFALVRILGKRRHQRGFVLTVHAPDRAAPPGLLPEPTLYLEDRKSGVKIKCYIRKAKLPAGGFGDLVVRLEWTLTRKPAIERYFGGNQISNLLDADLDAFLEGNIRLERVDHVALGNLFRGLQIAAPHAGVPDHVHGGRDHGHADDGDHGHDHDGARVRHQWSDPGYWPRRAALLVLRSLAYRELDKFTSWEQALLICQHSPAQIRGYCRELRDGRRPSRRGRPRGRGLQRRLPVTDHRINRCFRKVGLIEGHELV